MDADKITLIIYNVLSKNLTPEAMDRLVAEGLRARGSRSFHGFMLEIKDLHAAKKRKDHGTKVPTPRNS